MHLDKLAYRLIPQNANVWQIISKMEKNNVYTSSVILVAKHVVAL